MKKFLWIFFAGMLWGMSSLGMITGVIPDTYHAYTRTHQGDRWRLFMYYQTARHFGVPSALNSHGINPESKN